jgi:phage terminase large subunit
VVQFSAKLPEYARGLFVPARYKVFWGGRGAARSWSYAQAILIMGSQRKLRVLCCREFQKSIADSVHKLFEDQVVRLNLPGWDVGQKVITHKGTGTTILFEGLRYNTNRIKSLEGIDICWVEEAESVTKASWEILIPTIRKDESEIWISFNPDLESDPTYQRFVIGRPPNAIVQKVGWEDNPWFPEVLKEEKDYLYRVDPEAAEHVWGGVPRKTSEAQVLHGKWRVESFKPAPNQLDSSGRKIWVGPYTGADFGFSVDPTACTELWIKRSSEYHFSQGELHVYQESWKIKLDTHMIKRQWLRDIGRRIVTRIIRADSSRPETISYLKQHGLRGIRPAFKWPNSVEDGIAYLRQFEGIVIHPNCRHYKQEAMLYGYKVDDKTGEITRKIVDKHNHLIDATRYALVPMIRMRRSASNYSGHTYANSN